RERFNPNLLCIGTSATMASEGGLEERNKVVAEVASRLFGTEVKPENIITESLEPATAEDTPTDPASLAAAIRAGLPENPTHEVLAAHPVAAWVERNLGLEKQGERYVRISRPRTIEEAAAKLAQDSGLPVDECRQYLQDFLLMAYHVKNRKGQ